MDAHDATVSIRGSHFHCTRSQDSLNRRRDFGLTPEGHRQAPREDPWLFPSKGKASCASSGSTSTHVPLVTMLTTRLRPTPGGDSPGAARSGRLPRRAAELGLATRQK